MHFLGRGDYSGASCFQHDPQRWNPPFPLTLHQVLTEDEWSNFFRDLNIECQDGRTGAVVVPEACGNQHNLNCAIVSLIRSLIVLY